jgi:AcrR family transcriptional regulator
MSRERFFEDEHRIIDAAISLICENGYEKFSTRRLAARLGISPMTLYNYFSNKEEIVQVTISTAYEKAFEVIQNELKDYFEREPACPLMGFVEMGRKLFAFSKQYPQMYALVFVMHFSPYRDQPSLVECYNDTFKKVFERLVDKNIEEELQQHIYLFQVLVAALVSNIYNKFGPTDKKTFEINLLLAYNRLLKPFERYFAVCPETR